MAEDLYAFCERCGKPAASPLAKAPAAPKGLRRLLPGARQANVETPAPALRLCLGCRGYVCDECWNEPASVCQSCQPLEVEATLSVPTVLDQYAPPANGLAFVGEAAWPETDATARLSAMTSWPETDLRRTAAVDEEVEAQPAEASAEPVVPLDEDLEAAAEDVESQADDVEVEAELAEATTDADDASAEVEEPYVVHHEAEAEAEAEDMATNAADEAVDEEFDDRLAELLNRVQALGVTADQSAEPGDEPDDDAPMVEAPAVEDPAYVEERWRAQAVLSEMLEGVQDMREDVAVETDAQAQPTVLPLVAEPEWVAEADQMAEDEQVAEVDAAVTVDDEFAADEFAADEFAAEMAAAEEMADETVAADEPVAAEEPVVEPAADGEFERYLAAVAASAAVANEAPVAAEEAPAVTGDWADDAEVPAAETEPVVAAEFEATADNLPADVVEAPVAEPVAESAAGDDVIEEPALAAADPDEDLWAAVLGDLADESSASDAVEPDREELEHVLKPRPSIYFDPMVEPEPTPQPTPASVDVPPPPAPARVPHLPIAMPPRPPAPTTPWPMPAPPAFLPPPPPAMLSVVQPAPARFRPQIAVAPEPVELPSTRPCGSCGLELSAKVAFCRRCGTRQLSA